MTIEKKIVEALYKNNIIAKEEASLYIFGLKYLFGFLTNITTTVIVGAILGMIWECILFSVAYIPLRQYAGGYHAQDSRTCYILSTLLVVVALMVIQYANIRLTIANLALILSCLIIFIKAPVESKSKSLNAKEKKTFHKIACIIVVIEAFVSNILFLAMFKTAAHSILVAVLAAALSLLSFNHKQTS